MNIISWDTETKGFDWWDDQTAFIATTADHRREWVYDLSNPVESLAFQKQLCGADVLVAHNASFDVHQVRATIGFDILDLDAELHDTDIMARVYWPEGTYGEHGGFSLKNLAKVYVDPHADVDEEGIKEAGKSMGMRTLNKTGAYYEVWRAHPGVMEKYAMSDARYTWDLFELLMREDRDARLINDKRYAIYELERQIIPVLIRAEQQGAPVSRVKVKRLHKDYLKKQKRLRSDLATVLGDEALGGEGSVEALAEALQKQGIPLTERTETGQLAVNKFALAPFAKDYAVVRDLQDYQTVNKFLSTYIEPSLDRDWVHPNFRQIGTWTGRMSCVRPNMQNIPVRSGTEVRDIFTAPEGWKLVACDYDAIEMRLLAYYLGREGAPYRDLINSGQDPHAWMAAELAQRGVPSYASVGDTMDDFLKGTPGEGQRAKAKTTLFAIVYGAGGRIVCEYNDLPTGPPLKAGDWMVVNGFGVEGGPSYKQGQKLARDVKAAIPGYNSLMRKVKRKIEQHGYVTTLLGRKQAVARQKSYVGMSALIQGSAADVMKSGLLATNVEFYGDDRVRPVLFVHDEIVWMVKDEHGLPDAVMHAAQNAMQNAVQLNPPLLVSGKVAQSYGETK